MSTGGRRGGRASGRRTGRAAGLLAGLLFVAGCGTTPPSPPATGEAPTAAATTAAPPPSTAGPTAAPSPSASASPSPAEAGAVPAAQAWGTVATRRLPVGMGEGTHFVFADAATPDGRYLVGSIQRNKFGDSPGTTPGSVVLYEVATAKTTRIADLQDPESQVLSASADADWIVWMEASDQPYLLDFRLFAYARASGRVHEVAHATRKDGKAVLGPLSFVSLSHGVAVWGQAVGAGAKPGEVANAVVRQADLASGTVTTVATSAGWPVISWPLLAWIALKPDAAGSVVISNLETGWKGGFATQPPVLSIFGASMAYAAPDGRSMWLQDDVSGSAPPIEVARGQGDADYLEWPSLNDRIVAWAENNTSIVYDRALRELVTLPISTGWSSSTAAGPNLVWEEQDPSRPDDSDHGWVVVLDTTTLPAP